SGQVSRVIEALPRRILLRLGTKIEHLAAGGENDSFRRDRTPGRGRMDDLEMQIVWTDPQIPMRGTASDARSAARKSAEKWAPGARVVGVVAPGVRRAIDALRSEYPGCDVMRVGEDQDDAKEGMQNDTPSILVGDAESWQRHWALWQRIKLEGEMLILSESASELRA